MARASESYRPRRPGQSVLYRVVRDHLETFCVQSATLRGGEGLPRFVEEEFRAYLRCGWLAGGFARFRCSACGADRLVAFSCTGRGFCPSCGARRMTALTAHLVDHVFPTVPVRQWILSLPHRVRYLLAWDHGLCRAVTAVFLRAVMGLLRDRATDRGVTNGRSGAVAVVQRFGAALNLNVHIHALVLDGVFALEADGRPAFREGGLPSDDDVAEVLETVRRRVERLLDRRGYGVDDDGFAPDHWADDAPGLAYDREPAPGYDDPCSRASDPAVYPWEGGGVGTGRDRACLLAARRDNTPCVRAPRRLALRLRSGPPRATSPFEGLRPTLSPPKRRGVAVPPAPDCRV